MKKVLVLLFLSLLTLPNSASVVVRSNLVAYEQMTSLKSPIVNKIDLAENEINKTINDIKIKLQPIGTPKEDISGNTVNKTVTVSEITTTNTEEIKMESIKSETIQEVKKEKDSNTYVILKTEKGDIKIKLYIKEAPITAGNFLDLAKKKFYNGLTFHRLISGFMIQGGCPLGNGTGNYIDPQTKSPRYIKHETHPDLKHDKEGVVAMARTSDPDSASSQFFIDLGPQPFLDAGGADPYGYAIFGQVVEGMNVVHKIMNENIAPYPGSDGTSNPVKIVSVEVIE